MKTIILAVAVAIAFGSTSVRAENIYTDPPIVHHFTTGKGGTYMDAVLNFPTVGRSIPFYNDMGRIFGRDMGD